MMEPLYRVQNPLSGHSLLNNISIVIPKILSSFDKYVNYSLPNLVIKPPLHGDHRRAFYHEFEADIPIKHEVIVERVPLFNDDGTPNTDEVTEDDRAHSNWYDRNTMWLSTK